MAENGHSDAADNTNQVQETITVPDRDLTPAEMAKIMRQVARVCNFLGSLIMKHAALAGSDRTVGAGHPICQSILNCAVQADTAAINLTPQPPQIMDPRSVVPMPRRH